MIDHHTFKEVAQSFGVSNTDKSHVFKVCCLDFGPSQSCVDIWDYEDCAQSY